jgi:hypothetical protein
VRVLRGLCNGHAKQALVELYNTAKSEPSKDSTFTAQREETRKYLFGERGTRTVAKDRKHVANLDVQMRLVQWRKTVGNANKRLRKE